MDLEQLLYDRFGFPGFRPGQRAIVAHLVEGGDALVVMPTGAGKSLCYQVPALARPGTTLVVSPLIALMKDQVDALRERGVQATFLNSSIGREEYQARQRAVEAGEVELLYVAPERFTPSFLEWVTRREIGLLAIDEAHCLSQWGHDFRPDYLRLGKVRDALGRPPTVALTATATPEVQKDIVDTLGIGHGKVFIRGFDRENLLLDVLSVRGKAHKDALLPELVSASPALVYAATRKDVERAAHALREAGVRAGFYHAGLTPDERTQVQEDFMAGRVPVVVATNAFGMGIDKADIRTIVHYGLPGTVEAYYQEIGRAGRDGRTSRAVLLFRKQDRRVQQFFIDNSHPPADWVHRVWDWLNDQGDNPVYATIETMSRALPEDAGDRAASACLYQLQREGLVRRIAPSDRPASVSVARVSPADTPRGHRGLVWERVRAEGATHLSVDLDRWSAELELGRDQIVAALHGLADRGYLDFRVADRRGGVELLQPGQRLDLDEKKVRARRQREYAKLDRMVDYAGSGCRRRYIVEYFGENAPFEACGTCDRCRAGDVHGEVARALSPQEDEVVRMALACVARMDQKGGSNGWPSGLVAKTLTGSRDAAVKQWGFDTLSTYGLLGPRGRSGDGRKAPGDPWTLGQVADLLSALVASGALVERYVSREVKGKEVTYKELELSELGWSVMRRQADDFRMRFPHADKLEVRAEAVQGDAEDLLALLRDVRRQIAQRKNVPAYVVAPNKTLEDMARLRPTTRKAMIAVHGMGEVRWHAYGEQFVAAIREWNQAR